MGPSSSARARAGIVARAVFLKSLTLKGFKSFAEATTLELEPGVTVVVGPNGSGKSNVVDAIAWVLGAQAPSAVRSQKMDDVIFAGTASRPALGRAEVSLTIDNSAGLLGIEFSEVTVRRTLFRTGDSEYAINDVPCRLLDVQELLSDAGVGRQQHVIVSQGQIDAVLNARPEDRRAIVEEAAGVLKYRKRKEKAERRLDSTEASLVRVQDLLREVRRQLRPLERQAEAARRHGELIGELTALRVYLAGRDIAGLRTKLTALAAAKLDGAQAESALKAELARLDTEVMAVGADLTARGADDLSDRLVHVEQLRERARGLAAVIVERRRGSGTRPGAAPGRRHRGEPRERRGEPPRRARRGRGRVDHAAPRVGRRRRRRSGPRRRTARGRRAVRPGAGHRRRQCDRRGPRGTAVPAGRGGAGGCRSAPVDRARRGTDPPARRARPARRTRPATTATRPSSSKLRWSRRSPGPRPAAKRPRPRSTRSNAPTGTPGSAPRAGPPASRPCSSPSTPPTRAPAPSAWRAPRRPRPAARPHPHRCRLGGGGRSRARRGPRRGGRRPTRRPRPGRSPRWAPPTRRGRCSPSVSPRRAARTGRRGAIRCGPTSRRTECPSARCSTGCWPQR